MKEVKLFLNRHPDMKATTSLWWRVANVTDMESEVQVKIFDANGNQSIAVAPIEENSLFHNELFAVFYGPYTPHPTNPYALVEDDDEQEVRSSTRLD